MSCRRVALLLFALLAGPVFAGCLGGADDVPVPVAPAGALDAVDRSPRLVTANGTRPIAAWVEDLGEARAGPDALRLGQLAHWRTPNGAMRLLGDGQAFVLVVDQSVQPFAVGTVVLARIIDTDSNATVARGHWSAEATEPIRVPLALTPFDVIRVGPVYAYEVLVFSPDAAFDCGCALVNLRDDMGLVTGGIERNDTTPLRTNAWNGTVLGEWSGPLAFRPSWDVLFEGPAEGTDRPDPLEDSLLGGPETGHYSFQITGERIWIADLTFDFHRSRLAYSDPDAGGNGSHSLHVQLDGFQPLPSFLAFPPDKGLAQRFSISLFVDFETEADLPGDEPQVYTAATAVAYRIGGGTFVAGSDAETVDVRVRNVV